MTDAEEEALLLKAIEQRHALGLTSVRDLSLFPRAMRTYFRLWQKGQLTLRVSLGLDLPDAPHVEELPQHRLEGRVCGLDVDDAARVVGV